MFEGQLLGIEPGGAVTYLMEALSDASPATREAEAYTLGELAVVGTVPSLLNAHTGPDSAMRSNAAGALGKLGDAGAVDGLTDPDDATPANAADSPFAKCTSQYIAETVSATRIQNHTRLP